MKKQVLVFSFVLFLLVQQASAQQVWHLSGNSDATSTSKLGTLNSQALHLYTNNLERLQIDAEGRVIIGGSSSSASALFEVTSTTKGVLIPRMTQTQRNAILSPAQGLLVYQRDGVGGFYYYDGGWKPLTPPPTNTSGFANTALSNLVPTSINQDLVPDGDNTRSLGSSTIGWQNLYLTNGAYLNGQRFLSGPGDNTFTGKRAGASNTGTSNTANGYQALFSNTTATDNTAVGANALFSNTTGLYNTAVGSQALHSNLTGNNNAAYGYQALYNSTGTSNTAMGSYTLYSNSTGNNNTALGAYSLNSNTTGDANVAQGYNALVSNTTGGYNAAQGYQVLYRNTTGDENTAQGAVALLNNTTGAFNTALGGQALYSNTTGNTNTAVGFNSLFSNTSSSFNTGVGYFSGYGCSTCTTATFLGTGASTTVDGLDNVTAVGSGATATASNTVVLGNAYVTDVRSTGTFTTTSDGRFKRDLKEEVPGLEFINKLRPVTYHYKIHELNTYIKQEGKGAQSNGGSLKGLKGIEAPKVDDGVTAAAKQKEEEGIKIKEAIKYSGFVAQEVEAAAKKVNYDFSGVHKPTGSKDVYGLSYAEFVVPLVKAVQELSQKNEEQQKQIDDLKEMVLRLTGSNNSNTSLSLSSAYLEVPVPNPSSGSTLLRYHVPSTVSNAKLVIADMKGSVLKTVNLSGRGSSQLTLSTMGLAAGAYTCTLYVDNAQIDAKQMIIAR